MCKSNTIIVRIFQSAFRYTSTEVKISHETDLEQHSSEKQVRGMYTLLTPYFYIVKIGDFSGKHFFSFFNIKIVANF